MARILVAGPSEGLVQQAALDRLVAKVRDDGHDAFVPGHDAAAAMADADAAIVLLEPPAPLPAAVAGLAHAMGRPCLGLHGPGDAPGPAAACCTTLHQAGTQQEWTDALPAFYEALRPFAGRLVRDLVPRLVKEAGHQLAFRELAAEDQPRFLRQKVLEEAKALQDAPAGHEKEEIADLLEALEALIRVRGYGREELKAVKDGKRKRRGAFERCYVVEATADGTGMGPAEPQDAAPATQAGAPAAADTPMAWGPAARAGPTAGPGADADDEPADPRVREEPPTGPEAADVAEEDSTVLEYPERPSGP